MAGDPACHAEEGMGSDDRVMLVQAGRTGSPEAGGDGRAEGAAGADHQRHHGASAVDAGDPACGYDQIDRPGDGDDRAGVVGELSGRVERRLGLVRRVDASPA